MMAHRHNPQVSTVIFNFYGTWQNACEIIRITVHNTENYMPVYYSINAFFLVFETFYIFDLSIFSFDYAKE